MKHEYEMAYRAMRKFTKLWDYGNHEEAQQFFANQMYCYNQKAWYAALAASVYIAHDVFTTPDFQMSEPDEKGVSSEKGDRLFEDTRQHLYDSGKLQI